MIFYNPQLMRTSAELALFGVSNPDEFDRMEDHRAAIELRIDELVEQSIESEEDPILLIESYLNLSYMGGLTAQQIADFIINSEPMISAMSTLKDNWSTYDPNKPKSMLTLISTTTKEESVEIYSQMTLRAFLEALSDHFNN